MAVLQLRHHIPISGSATREIVDGTESAMRVSLGFEPAWFHQRCEVDFNERWHRDPFYRYESMKRMKAELKKRFPMISYWDYPNDDNLATISGCYGIYVIPQVFGILLRYAADRWPDIAPGQKPAVDDIEALDIEKLMSGPFVEELFGQMDNIESEWGKIHGYLHFQGIINNAFHMRGQDIFLDMIERPDFAHRFFKLICDVMIELARKVYEKQRRSGFYINHLSVSNCTMNMISPAMYHEFIFPHDKRIALSFERFGVHTCNWKIDPYIDEFKALPNLGYLDMGMESDLKRVRDTFPETRRAVLYWPTKLQDAPIEEIKLDLERVFRDLAPCDMVMADIQATTSDERVIEFYEICQELESLNEH